MSEVADIGAATKKRAGKPAAGDRTELEVSEMFAKRFGAELRYCAALGGWHRWDGSRWALDAIEHARECVKVVARDLAGTAAALLDGDTFKAAKRAGSASGVAAILDLARSTPGIVFTPDAANRDPWLLNARNGTVDLRTGALRAHERDDLITRVCPVDFDSNATASTFDRFLEEVQPAADVRAYLARVFGYAAVGVVRDHVLAVLWGVGANGKSVLADVVCAALGDYAGPGPSSLIVGDVGDHEPHPTDVASCVGARLVLVHETKRGAAFNASKVKHLTGGDRLKARFMHRDYFEFAPSHTLVMLSNYRPEADATDAALWRRVQLCAFAVVIPEARRDATLAETIKRDELAGVLAWIVRGCVEWQRAGLAPPASVREETERYRASEDVISAFLAERCTRVAGASVKAGALYEAFVAWCKAAGTRAVRNNDFAADIVGRGIERGARTSRGHVYRGLGLRQLTDDDDA